MIHFDSLWFWGSLTLEVQHALLNPHFFLGTFGRGIRILRILYGSWGDLHVFFVWLTSLATLLGTRAGGDDCQESDAAGLGAFFSWASLAVFFSNLVSVCSNIIFIWTDYLKLLVPKCAKPQGDWGTKPSYIAPTKRNQSLVSFLFSEAFGGFHIGMYLMYWGNRID
jgi:hypothetical protein